MTMTSLHNNSITNGGAGGATPSAGGNKILSFSVWVGGLATSVDEAVLEKHFKKYGPIRTITGVCKV